MPTSPDAVAHEALLERGIRAQFPNPFAGAIEREWSRFTTPRPCVRQPPFLCGGELRSIFSGMDYVTTIEGFDEIQPMRPEFGNFGVASLFPASPLATVIDGDPRMHPPRGGMPPGASGLAGLDFTIASLFTPPRAKEGDREFRARRAPRRPDPESIAREAEGRSLERWRVACAAAERTNAALARIRDLDREVASKALTPALLADALLRRKAAAALALREAKLHVVARLASQNAKAEAVVARQAHGAAKTGDTAGAASAKTALTALHVRDRLLLGIRARQKVRWSWGTAKIKADAVDVRVRTNDAALTRLRSQAQSLRDLNIKLRATPTTAAVAQIRKNEETLKRIAKSIAALEARQSTLKAVGATARKRQGAIGAAHGAVVATGSTQASGGIGGLEGFDDAGLGFTLSPEGTLTATGIAATAPIAGVVEKQVNQIVSGIAPKTEEAVTQKAVQTVTAPTPTSAVPTKAPIATVQAALATVKQALTAAKTTTTRTTPALTAAKAALVKARAKSPSAEPTKAGMGAGGWLLIAGAAGAAYKFLL